MQSPAPVLALPQLPPAYAGGLLCVAYSGGLDSSVLLRLLAQTYPDRLRAVHVHHGLQAVADDWAERCRGDCAALGLPFELRRLGPALKTGEGPEAAARRARYAALAAALRPGEILVTAHHQDDQAETFLLRALRGAGVAGLGAMREWQRFPPGWLWRPLLRMARARLLDWAREQGLSWIEDPHNADARYARSYLRSRVLPELRALEPAAAAKLAHSAAWCAEAATLMDERAQQDAAALLCGDALELEGLRQLSAPRRKNLLRWWLAQRGLPAPRQSTLARLDAELIGAAKDAGPCLRWPGAELRRFRGRLYAQLPLAPLPLAWVMSWRGEPLELPAGAGRVWSEARVEELDLRFLRPGEHFRPAGAVHARSLKNLFQEAGVPPWWRGRTPVVERAGAVLWIGGLGPAEGAPPWAAALRWSRDPGQGDTGFTKAFTE